MPKRTPTTFHDFDLVLKKGARYDVKGHVLFYQDGRFYVQAGNERHGPYTTVGEAIVALLFAIGSVEVPR